MNSGSGMTNSVWMGIIRNGESIEGMGIPFGKSIIKKVGNSEEIRFWEDVWCDARNRLKDVFPHLYALESLKICFISNRWKCIHGGRSLDDLNNLLNDIFYSHFILGSKRSLELELEPISYILGFGSLYVGSK